MRLERHPVALSAIVVASAIVVWLCVDDKNRHRNALSERPISPMRVEARANELVALWTAHTSKDPGGASGWRRLAEAEVALARATGRHDLYASAESHVRRSLELLPKNNIEAEGVLAAILVSRHRFVEALRLSEALLQREGAPSWMRGVAADAAVAYGDLERAQYHLDRLGETSSGFGHWTRQAHLDWLCGRIESARANLVLARDRYDGVDPEPAAWVRVQLGIIDLETGATAAARRHFEAALEVAPGYYLAEEHLAETYEIEGNDEKARVHLERAIAAVRESHFLVRLAGIEERAGHIDVARALVDEARSMLERSFAAGDTSIARELAELCLDHPRDAADLARGLELARLDATMRKGVDVDHVLAKALRMNGYLDDAAVAAERSTRHGTPMADYWDEAATIARARGKNDEAERYESRRRVRRR